MNSPEVVVTLDGRPRPAVVIDTEGDRTLVRFRDAGTFREEWVPTADVVAVEAGADRPNLLKLGGLLALGVIGLVLVLYPGGSDTPLVDSTPSPTPSTSASPSPSPSGTRTPGAAKAVTAVLFGDSFVAGRALEKGSPTAVQVAAALLGWEATVLGGDGTAYTTGGKRGGQPYATRLAREVRSTPDVLLLQGGASDTAATPEQLTRAATAVLDGLKQRFPTTRLVMLGPMAMEQPPDGQLVRVSATLKAVADSRQVTYLDPIALHWITPANHAGYTAATGYYPNAAGHAYLGRRLAAALRALGLS